MDYWNIWIDTGGTFTDCVAHDPKGGVHHIKVLSNSSLRGTIEEILSPTKIRIHQNWEAPDDFVSGLIFCMLHEDMPDLKIDTFSAKTSILTFKHSTEVQKFQKDAPFEISSDEEAPILAARLVTQTPRNQQLPPIQLRLATTKGTNALLEKKGAPTLLLITKGFRDFLYIGDQKRPDLFALNIQKPSPLFDQVIEVPERLDADGKMLQKLETKGLSTSVRNFLKQEDASVAVCLMHSYKNKSHEKEIERWLSKLGAHYISCSSDMSPSIKLLPRAQTTVVNAYLEPVLHQYLHSVQASLSDSTVFVMNSAAGLVSSAKFNPKDSLLSGPAGGVIGAAAIGRVSGKNKIISLDMGGTSTDVARYENGFDYQFEHTVGSASIKSPSLAIETVAAGGGSICSFDGQKLTVGPDSAGANPGPACYDAGGPLTLTDVNLLLGRLQPTNFNIPISKKASERKLQKLLNVIEASGQSADKNEILAGLLQIANERMADAINKVSLQKGYDPSNYALVAFGGAGAQHATAIASLLDIKTVLVPDKAGLLSAYGLGTASVEAFTEQQILKKLPKVEPSLKSMFRELGDQATNKLQDDLSDKNKSPIKIKRRMIFMRLAGQEATLELEFKDTEQQLHDDFKETYQNRYGHWIENREIEVESIRVVAAASPDTEINQAIPKATEQPPIDYFADVQFKQKSSSTPVYQRTDLRFSHQIDGPAIILDPYSTTIIEPRWHAKIQNQGTIELTHKETSDNRHAANYSEAINLELFTNRFTSIAEEMGEMMRRTALSVNVKERMDFSCALLNAKGELVVNAPHIPVHLGALGLCVRRLKETISMEAGDVVVTNHPRFGGSHLPDITVVTPIFDAEDILLGYAACRAHHAEIGGTRPGSMPPDATTLAEEGVVIPPSYLVKKGTVQWEKMNSHFKNAPYPSRAIEENMADLQAAIAANHQGAEALKRLAKDEGVSKVQHYMSALKSQAAERAKTMIRNLPDLSEESIELLDDGSRLKAEIEKDNDQLYVDFTGSADVHPGNLNATPAIVHSVIMYVLRCLIRDPIPLNEGLLHPVTINLPEGMLNPNFEKSPAQCPAVVGGNTETSQRLVDLLLKPFRQVACSQGTMNNVLFGNESFGYYETIGGGTGAGPGFNGADAIHHHMTNTAGTDPEILEHRYPVRLERYKIRKSSGGTGKYQGGNGITRELSFLEPVSLSVLTQHRKVRPYGLNGGREGKRGSQYIIRKKGNKEDLNSVDGAKLQPGERFVIHTPGGGGFGE